jgi:four helix bundle protein
VQRFRRLNVWRRSHQFALNVYRISAQFPAGERFGRTAQLRRAVLSVPTNIAEGSKRLGRQEYARFLNIAEGSLAEVEYLLMFSRDLGYLESEVSETSPAKADEIARMLSSLRPKVGQAK